MKKKSLLILLILVAASITASLAYAGADHKRELAAIRRATAKYRDLDAALADGYEILFDCTVKPDDPSLAMGQHYLNSTLAGDDLLDLATPEVLMYEPQANGQMKLVGVEYIIFEDNWTGGNAPEFLGRTMARKTAVGTNPVPAFYEVHAWAWSHNPNGDFADWSSNVSCR